VVSRFARWYEEHPRAGDAALAAALLLFFALPADLTADTGEAAADLAFSVALIACVPFRRLAPVAVFAAVAGICLVQLALLDHIVAGDVVALIALYTVVAYGPGTVVAVAATASAAAGAALAALRWDQQTGQASTFDVAASAVASVLLAAAVGAWRRTRRDQLDALEERNRLLALERDQQAAVGAAIERARIARELHDVVAHSLSVIVVQADGAAAGAEQRPAAAAAALRTIGDTGRDALAQMRRLLGVLREEQEPELAPQPGTAQLAALVEQVVRAGLPAELTVRGEPRPLEATADVTLYRIAQEALTNVLKHAGDVSRVELELRYGDDAVELALRDDGRGERARSDGRGQGLAGMRERVDVHDGTLHAGPRADGGFEVRATIPSARVGAAA
jgi:signal transduction histidine kinase